MPLRLLKSTIHITWLVQLDSCIKHTVHLLTLILTFSLLGVWSSVQITGGLNPLIKTWTRPKEVKTTRRSWPPPDYHCIIRTLVWSFYSLKAIHLQVMFTKLVWHCYKTLVRIPNYAIDLLLTITCIYSNTSKKELSNYPLYYCLKICIIFLFLIVFFDWCLFPLLWHEVWLYFPASAASLSHVWKSSPPPSSLQT